MSFSEKIFSFDLVKYSLVHVKICDSGHHYVCFFLNQNPVSAPNYTLCCFKNLYFVFPSPRRKSKLEMNHKHKNQTKSYSRQTELRHVFLVMFELSYTGGNPQNRFRHFIIRMIRSFSHDPHRRVRTASLLFGRIRVY